MTKEEQIDKIIDSVEEEFAKVEIPIMDKLTLFAKVQNALYKCAEINQEPCEDAISRAEAIDTLGYDISIESDRGLDEYKSVIKEMLFKIYDVQKANIEKLPPVTPKPKTGHWKYYRNNKGDWINECSACGLDAGVGYPYQYCPNCGAKMEEKEKNNG